jgi:hypothetical protein
MANSGGERWTTAVYADTDADALSTVLRRKPVVRRLLEGGTWAFAVRELPRAVLSGPNAPRSLA